MEPLEQRRKVRYSGTIIRESAARSPQTPCRSWQDIERGWKLSRREERSKLFPRERQKVTERHLTIHILVAREHRSYKLVYALLFHSNRVPKRDLSTNNTIPNLGIRFTASREKYLSSAVNTNEGYIQVGQVSNMAHGSEPDAAQC